MGALPGAVRERELIGTACLFCMTRLYVARQGHHRAQLCYLILQRRLKGFSGATDQVIATIARYQSAEIGPL